MRGSGWKLKHWFTGFALAGLGGLLCSQPARAADEPKDTIKFTEPVSRRSSTNQADSYQPLDLDSLNNVRKPYEPFNAADSFSGAMSPPPSFQRGPQLSPAALRKMQDTLDRKKNWAFLTPEEVYGIQSPEEIMNMPEYGANGERITQPKTSIERYMQRMENSRLSAQSNRLSGDQLTDVEQEEKEKKRLEEKAKPALGILAAPITSPALANGFLSSRENQGYLNPALTAPKGSGEAINFEGFLPKENAFARTPLQESRMQEFKKMLEPKPFVPAPSLSPTFTPPAVTPSSFGGLANQGALSGIGGAPIPPPSLNPNGTVLGAALPSYIPAYTPPPPTTPRYGPARPVFDPPARKF